MLDCAKYSDCIAESKLASSRVYVGPAGKVCGVMNGGRTTVQSCSYAVAPRVSVQIRPSSQTAATASGSLPN